MACTNCKILECNPRVVSDPELLWRRPHDSAFLLVGALHADEERRLKADMVSEAEFCKARGLDPADLRCGYFELSDYARIHARCASSATQHTAASDVHVQQDVKMEVVKMEPAPAQPDAPAQPLDATKMEVEETAQLDVPAQPLDAAKMES
jgi:hypothetical protein